MREEQIPKLAEFLFVAFCVTSVIGAAVFINFIFSRERDVLGEYKKIMAVCLEAEIERDVCEEIALITIGDN